MRGGDPDARRRPHGGEQFGRKVTKRVVEDVDALGNHAEAGVGKPDDRSGHVRFTLRDVTIPRRSSGTDPILKCRRLRHLIVLADSCAAKTGMCLTKRHSSICSESKAPRETIYVKRAIRCTDEFGADPGLGKGRRDERGPSHPGAAHSREQLSPCVGQVWDQQYRDPACAVRAHDGRLIWLAMECLEFR